MYFDAPSKVFRFLVRIIVCLLAIIAVSHAYRAHGAIADAVNTAAEQVAKAERDRQELLEVLNGKRGMVEYAGKYIVIERVTWEEEPKNH